MGPLRYLDCVMVLAAAPFVVLAELPVTGYLVGAAAWLVQRLLGAIVERKARAARDAKTFTGLLLASTLGRAWLVGLTILAAGQAGEREDGLMAAVLILAAFTVYFATTLILRPHERKPTNP
jgi:hypothetical protein